MDVERDWAIRTIFGEAEGESPEGWKAVAHVIRNRLRSGRWGPTVETVVHAAYQFECWQNPQRRKRLMALKEVDPTYEKIGQAWDASAEEPDLTRGATHFVARALQLKLGRTMPSWATAQAQTAKIGSHTFYKA